MKKSIRILFCAVMILAMALCVFTACNTTIQSVKFKITFDVDGVSYFEINTQGSEVLQMPDNPTKEDYLFDGWYWDKDEWNRPFTANSLLNEPLNADMTVYAKWIEEDITKRTYTVSFNSKGGSVVESVKVKYGKTFAAPERPIKTGYALVGWYKEADCATKWNFSSDTVMEDIELFAKWVDESDATGCDILSANGFNIEGNTLSIKVPNSQEHFVLSDAITVSAYAEWAVTSDIAGRNEIPSATVALSVGDNTYYINTVSGTGSNKKQYTLRIRRREMYSVTYIFNNGDENEVITAEEDSLVEPRDEGKEKIGYTFVEWQKDEEKWNFTSDTVVENTVLEAVWSANTYTVKFDSDGGNKVDNSTVVYDENFTWTIPTKNGYTFVGWKDANGTLVTNNIGESKAVWSYAQNELTFTAVWQVNSYTITYNNMTNATSGNPTSYTVEDANIALKDASKIGYTFEGWFTEKEFKTEVSTLSTSAAVAYTVWAKWEVNIYKATFVADGVKVGEDEFTIEESKLDTPEIPQKTGYIGEWDKYTITLNDAHDLTVNAVYTPIIYNINYNNTKNVENDNPKTYTIESDTITFVSISADGYTFTGWFVGDEEITEIEGGSYGHRTITAKWDIIEYNLHFEYDEGIGGYESGTSNVDKYTIESDFDLMGLVNFTDGYYFTGWYTAKNDGEGEKIDRIVPGQIGDKTFYAHWGLEAYQIIYHNIGNAINTNATNYTVLSEDITIENLSLRGYDFDGWFSDSTLTTPANTVIKTGSHGDMHFYAKWTPIEYNLTFNLYGGQYEGDVNPAHYTIEDAFAFMSPTLSGYVFDGWYTAAEGGEKLSGISEGMAGHLTLYAHWIYISTITYNSNGGSAVANTVQPAGSAITAPSVPTKDHYDFAGWFVDANLQNEFEFDVMPVEDTMLYAKWTPIEYAINYYLNGGENSKSNPLVYTVETSFTFAEPTKVGYSFVAWFTNATFTSQPISKIVAGTHGELNLYASFSINQYTISFDTNGGTSIEPITQNYATVVAQPADPAKNGYSFDGWYSDSNLRTAYTFTTMPAEDITIYAKWALVNYDIVYNLDGGTNASTNPATYNIMSSAISLSAPTKTGYTFEGWYSDASFNTAFTSIPCGSYGVKEVYAKWEIIVYQINYVIDENTVNDNITEYTVETDITELLDATLKGHTFDGWFKNSTFTQRTTTVAGGMVGNVTLYGKFTPNDYTVWMDGNDEAVAIVTFNLNGASGNAPAAQTVTKTDGLTYPSVPMRSGYIFGGWYGSAECEGQAYDFTATVGGNLTLYAKWVALDRTNAINIGENKTVALRGKTEIIYRFVPLVSGNISITTIGGIDTFGSLYRNGSMIKQNDDDGDGSNFLIVYNVTAGQTYDVYVRAFSLSANGNVTLSISGSNYVADGGHTKTGNKRVVKYGNSFTLPVPESDGNHKFLGWEDISGILYTDGNGNSVRNWDKDEDTVLLSKWEKMEYTVTFVTNDGTAVNDTNSVLLEYGARLDLNLYVTSRTNYTFSGWYLSASDAEAYNASTMPDHNITLYAKWTTFALGSIKYDEDKKAVSEFDTITADLFDAICLDTNGVAAMFSVTVYGTQIAGNTITVRLTATSGNKTKQVTVTEIKVYGEPTLTVTNTDKDYINPNEFTANAWGASGTDTYGNTTEIEVTVDGEYECGDVVTVIVAAIDVAGNRTEQRINGVKVYGAPVITYNEAMTGVSTLIPITAEFFTATAVDSFGEPLTVTATKTSGTLSVGNTVAVRLSATDSKGNVKNIDLMLKVYGEPTISNATTTDFKVEDVINVETLGLTAENSYGEPLDIVLTISGSQIAGATIICTATVSDVTGNVVSKDISIKIYGRPTITYDRIDIKVTEDAATSVCAVSFDLNGASGTAPATQIVTDTVGLQYPSIPTRSGYAFAGWYDNASCSGVPFDFSADVTSKKTLYAKWISYSGTGMLNIGESKSISVVDKSSSTYHYYAFVPLTSGQVSIYSTSSWDTYGYLYDDSKTQLTSNDDSGDGNNFKITYSVTAGTLYYVRPCGYNSGGTLTIHLTGDLPLAGGKRAAGNNSAVLNAVAKDSFGKALDLTITLKDGEVVGGQTVKYTLTATDHLGNMRTIDTVSIKVYDENDIQLSYMNMATDIIKYTSRGEEFDAYATDSFGEMCDITFETAAGFTFAGGNTVDLYIVATDKAGNVKRSELISGIRIFAMPMVEEFPEFVSSSTNLDFEFKVVDSFGEELVFNLEVDGEQIDGARINVILSATDDAGNALEIIYNYIVGHMFHTEGGEWTIVKQSTCTEEGERRKLCTECGYVLESESIAKLPHSYNDNDICENCGSRPPYKMSSDRNYIYFGEYPQTVKASNVTVGTTADADGYYLGSDGYRYAKVTATPYNSGYTFSTGASVSSGTVYYFKVEPIKWRILKRNADGTAVILCESIIANHCYYKNTSNRTIDGKTVYPNNYKYSDIRAWLNDEFYNKAFNEYQKAIIETTTVNNSASTTWDSSNSYACENTEDKVWLLSAKDTVNTSYGFNSSNSNYDVARRRQTSDYSRATGAYMSIDSSYYGNGWWWLRSPHDNYSRYACDVSSGGDGSIHGVSDSGGGVVPALTIRL